MTITADTILTRYAADIAFAAEGEPATTFEDFIAQLGTAARNLGYGGIHGAEDLEIAAQYLSDAMDSGGIERDVLLTRAARDLKDIGDMVYEYRLMV